MIRIKIVVVGLFLLLSVSLFSSTLQDGGREQVAVTVNEWDVNVSSVLEWRTLLWR